MWAFSFGAVISTARAEEIFVTCTAHSDAGATTYDYEISDNLVTMDGNRYTDIVSISASTIAL